MHVSGSQNSAGAKKCGTVLSNRTAQVATWPDSSSPGGGEREWDTRACCPLLPVGFAGTSFRSGGVIVRQSHRVELLVELDDFYVVIVISI